MPSPVQKNRTLNRRRLAESVTAIELDSNTQLEIQINQLPSQLKSGGVARGVGTFYIPTPQLWNKRECNFRLDSPSSNDLITHLGNSSRRSLKFSLRLSANSSKSSQSSAEDSERSSSDNTSLDSNLKKKSKESGEGLKNFELLLKTFTC